MPLQLSHLVTALLSTLIVDRPNKEKSVTSNENILKMEHVQYASQILKLGNVL